MELDQSIRLHDKLLLILSRHSIGSEWVEDEVTTAFEEERKRGKTVLFPVRLDNTVSAISYPPSAIKAYLTRHTFRSMLLFESAFTGALPSHGVRQAARPTIRRENRRAILDTLRCCEQGRVQHLDPIARARPVFHVPITCGCCLAWQTFRALLNG